MADDEFDTFIAHITPNLQQRLNALPPATRKKFLERLAQLEAYHDEHGPQGKKFKGMAQALINLLDYGIESP